MGRFDSGVAIVTGAGQGIGAATARRLATDGAAVAVVDVNTTAARAVAAELSAAGGSARAYTCDVADQAAVDTTVDQIAEDLGTPTILVNNAGIIRDNLIHKMDAADWNDVLAVTLTGTFHFSQAAQRHMVPAQYGRIVSLSSRSALGNPGQANYSAAKAGIQGLTATLALELGRFNITVNAVAPGYIATAMTASIAERVGTTVAQHRESAAASIPLRRVGQPEEVAAVVAFLASQDASYVSGQTVYVNGGAR